MWCLLLSSSYQYFTRVLGDIVKQTDWHFQKNKNKTQSQKQNYKLQFSPHEKISKKLMIIDYCKGQRSEIQFTDAALKNGKHLKTLLIHWYSELVSMFAWIFWAFYAPQYLVYSFLLYCMVHKYSRVGNWITIGCFSHIFVWLISILNLCLIS